MLFKKKHPISGRNTSLNAVLQDAFPNRSYKDILEIVFYNAKEFLQSLPLYRGNDIEILAFLSRIGNVTVQWVGGDIYSYKAQVEAFVDSIIPKEKKKMFLQ